MVMLENPLMATVRTINVKSQKPNNDLLETINGITQKHNNEKLFIINVFYRENH